ncbi:MAG: hypothetical protein IJU10_03880 [Clostridia bacterium]|nr:hypothetical protein [Clostridia bacterium]
MVIAERIRLKCLGEVISGIILILLGIGGAIFSAICESRVGTIISLALTILLFIFVIVTVTKTNYHNDLPIEAIIYKEGAFVFTDEDGSQLAFYPQEVLDLDYKLKVTHTFTLYFSETKTWNYGRLRIWLEIPGNDEECTLLTLKNIAEPDRVVERILFIINQTTEFEE